MHPQVEVKLRLADMEAHAKVAKALQVRAVAGVA
jgi:hypothetical protein